MSGNNKNYKINERIEEQVVKNHEKILMVEKIERDEIDIKIKQANKIIENDKLKFKAELNKTIKSKEIIYKETELELEMAMKKGDTELIKALAKRLESLI